MITTYIGEWGAISCENYEKNDESKASVVATISKQLLADRFIESFRQAIVHCTYITICNILRRHVDETTSVFIPPMCYNLQVAIKICVESPAVLLVTPLPF